jgi:hypothetical protein
MTSTNGLGALLAPLAGAALALTAAGPGQGQGSPKNRAVELSVSTDKGYFGVVVRDGDRFVALRFRRGEGGAPIRTFKKSGNMLKVDGMYLGYDLGGKSKDVLARDGLAEDLRDIRWEVALKRGSREVERNFRVANGALKGWWVGLGPAKPAKAGGRERARLILVKDREDAAGFSWPFPEDDRSP